MDHSARSLLAPIESSGDAFSVAIAGCLEIESHHGWFAFNLPFGSLKGCPES